MSTVTEWVRPGQKLAENSPDANHTYWGEDTTTAGAPVVGGENAYDYYYNANSPEDHALFVHPDSATPAKPYIIYTGFDAANAVPPLSKITGVEVRLLLSSKDETYTYVGPEDAGYLTVSLSSNENPSPIYNWVTGDTGAHYPITQGNLGPYAHKDNELRLDYAPFNDYLSYTTYFQQAGGIGELEGNKFSPILADHPHLGNCYTPNMQSGGVFNTASALRMDGTNTGHQLDPQNQYYENINNEWITTVISESHCLDHSPSNKYERRWWDGKRVADENYTQVGSVETSKEREGTILTTQDTGVQPSYGINHASMYPVYFGGPTETWGLNLPDRSSASDATTFMYGENNTLAVKIKLEEWSSLKSPSDIRLHEVAIRFHYIPLNFELEQEVFSLSNPQIHTHGVTLNSYFGPPDTLFNNVHQTHTNPVEMNSTQWGNRVYSKGLHTDVQGSLGSNTGYGSSASQNTGYQVIRKSASEWSVGDINFRIGAKNFFMPEGLDNNDFESQYHDWYSYRGIGPDTDAWHTPIKEASGTLGQLHVEMDLKDLLDDFTPAFCAGTHNQPNIFTEEECCSVAGGTWDFVQQYCSGNNPEVGKWIDDVGSEILGIKFILSCQLGYGSQVSLTSRNKLRGFTAHIGGWNHDDIGNQYNYTQGDNEYYEPGVTNSGHYQVGNEWIWENANSTGTGQHTLLNQSVTSPYDYGYTYYNSDNQGGSGFYDIMLQAINSAHRPDFEERLINESTAPPGYVPPFNGPYSMLGYPNNFEQKPICNGSSDICLHLKLERKSLEQSYLSLMISTEKQIKKLYIQNFHNIISGFATNMGQSVSDKGYGLFDTLNYSEEIMYNNDNQNIGSITDPDGDYMLFNYIDGESAPFPETGYIGRLATIMIPHGTDYNSLAQTIQEEYCAAYDFSGNPLSVSFTNFMTTNTYGWFNTPIVNRSGYETFSFNPWFDFPIDINGSTLVRLQNLARQNPNGRVKLVLSEISNAVRSTPSLNHYHPKLENRHYCNNNSTIQDKDEAGNDWIGLGEQWDPETDCLNSPGGAWLPWDVSGYPVYGVPNIVHSYDQNAWGWEGVQIDIPGSKVVITYKKKRKDKQASKIMGYFDRQDPNYDGTSPQFNELMDIDQGQMQVMDFAVHGVQDPITPDYTFFGNRYSWYSGATYDSENPDHVIYDGSVSFENAYIPEHFDGSGSEMPWYANYKYLYETATTPASDLDGACWPTPASAKPSDHSIFTFDRFTGQTRVSSWGDRDYGSKRLTATGDLIDPFVWWSNWGKINFGGSGWWTSGTGNQRLMARENMPEGWEFPNGSLQNNGGNPGFSTTVNANPCLLWENYKTDLFSRFTGEFAGFGASGIKHIAPQLNSVCNQDNKCSAGRRKGKYCNNDGDCPDFTGLRAPSGWNLQYVQTSGTTLNNRNTFDKIPGKCYDGNGYELTDLHNRWEKCMCAGRPFRLNPQPIPPGDWSNSVDGQTGQHNYDTGFAKAHMPKSSISEVPYTCTSGTPSGNYFVPYDDYSTAEIQEGLGQSISDCNNKSRITSQTNGTGPFFANESNYLAPPSGTTSIYAHGAGSVNLQDFNNEYVGSCSGPGNPYPDCVTNLQEITVVNDWTHSHGGDGQYRLLQTPNIQMRGAKKDTAFLEFWIHMYSDDIQQMGRFWVDVTRMDHETSTPQSDNGTMKFYSSGGDGQGWSHGWEPAEMHLYWDETTGPTHCGPANAHVDNYVWGSCTEQYVITDADSGYSLGLEELHVYDDPWIAYQNHGNPLGKWNTNPVTEDLDNSRNVLSGRIQSSCTSKTDPLCQWAKVRVPLEKFLDDDASSEDNMIRVQFRYLTRTKEAPLKRSVSNNYLVFDTDEAVQCPKCVMAGVQGTGKDSDKSDIHIDSVRIVADRYNLDLELALGDPLDLPHTADVSQLAPDGIGGWGGVDGAQSSGPAWLDTANNEIDITSNAGVHLAYTKMSQLEPFQVYQLNYEIRNYTSGAIRPHIGKYESWYDFNLSDNVIWTGDTRFRDGFVTETFVYRPIESQDLEEEDTKFLWFQTQLGYSNLAIANVSVRPLIYSHPEEDNPRLTLTQDFLSNLEIEENVKELENKRAIEDALANKDSGHILNVVAKETGVKVDDLKIEIDSGAADLIMGFGRCSGCGFPSKVGICGPLSGGCWGIKKGQLTWDKRL